MQADRIAAGTARGETGDGGAGEGAIPHVAAPVVAHPHVSLRAGLHAGLGLEEPAGPDRRAFLRAAVLLGSIGVGSVAIEQTVSRKVRLERGRLRSRFLPGRPLEWRVAVPSRPTGLVLAFHGKGGTSNVWFDVLDAARIARRTGLAVAAIDGLKSYWHPRRDSDATTMITDEFLPLLADRKLPTDRIGLTGVSMGGYGALYLASALGPERVTGVATMSAALRWRYGDTSAGAFDDEADFEAHSIFARTDLLRTIPISLCCGRSDRFIRGNEALARVLPHAESTFDVGGHTTDYCKAHWLGQMEWLAERA
ncbi:alpha/beta hydrolase-fold protein [Agilicoccus flavus]|uniref:alpha/beta hydrolase-fold protein n=1 Tax=Agilicoccus flavus TaxID=2775968 RepID=UPI001CF63E51|nr:alpha/beta hydrolase-fold protein [Agilicoccus flavus]